PGLAAVVELWILAVVRLLRERRHVEVDLLGHRRRARESALLVRQVRNARGGAADGDRPLRFGEPDAPVDREPQLVGNRRMILREERVDRDEAVPVALPADRRAVEDGG